ncbi:MAG: hypothetical protein OEY45_11545 [Gammaproteobacteria bacterium]|nr:hypothetical protein [Gammaproteobacteria bacterium]
MDKSRWPGAAFALLVILNIPLPVLAGLVLNTNDSGPGSLRAAIANATAVDNEITFDPALSGQTITLGGSPLVINKIFSLVINATSLPDGITISGNNASRVFQVTAGSFGTISGLTITAGSASDGAGIHNDGGILFVTYCTVAGNHATSKGGGLYNVFGNLLMLNVTFAANTSGNAGGGLVNESGNVVLRNTTVSGNTATVFGGGIVNDGPLAALDLENSIVAGNNGPAAGNGPDIGNRNAGTINPAGANLIGDNDTVSSVFPAGPLVGTTASPLDPVLAPLGDYTGPSETLLPLHGSPAIDAAITPGGTPPDDQRGIARPTGPANDLGAVEVIDSDGDGLDDGYELNITGTDPNNVDTDGDGLADGPGGVVTLAAYPGGIDADGDGFVDGEQDLGTDPVVSNVGDLAPRGNPDNQINTGDLLVLFRLVTGVIQPTALEATLADINGDTVINVADILVLMPSILN